MRERSWSEPSRWVCAMPPPADPIEGRGTVEEDDEEKVAAGGEALLAGREEEEEEEETEVVLEDFRVDGGGEEECISARSSITASDSPALEQALMTMR